MVSTSDQGFVFPAIYSWPPFWTLQPTLATRQAQLREWTSFILSYCRENRIWRLTIVDALNVPLFYNSKLQKRMNLLEAREILDWMTREVGGQRAEWIGKEGDRSVAWIYWRRPEEWAEVFSNWIDETGQKNTVLTLYELIEGESTISQDFHGMDPDILQKSLMTLVKRGKAQIFGDEDQQGVKFF